MMRLAKWFTCTLLLVLVFATPGRPRLAEVASIQKQEISIKAADGITLKGTLYKTDKEAPGILLSHMCDGKGRAAWEALATRLAQSGFHVLTWNYRGVGDSEGEAFRGGSMQEVLEYWRTKWRSDADAALKFLIAQPGVNKSVIGAGGASCGVYMSLLLAERHPDAVKSLVLLSGPIDDETKAFVEKRDKLSILGVTSEEDRRSAAWTKEIVAASTNPASKLLLYQDGGHGTQMLEKKPELELLIVEWFKGKLAK
jgi:dipeptidyl aminopeptidase/acylaminoacyl peptidase